MNIQKLNATLTATANIGVLIGLVLIFLELRQNDETLNATVQLSLSSAYEEMATFPIENPALQDSIIRAYTDPGAMTLRDDVNIMAWQYRYLMVLHTTYQLRNAGVVTEEDWKEKVGHLTVTLASSPKMVELYEGSRIHDEFFSREFYAEIDEILATQTN